MRKGITGVIAVAGIIGLLSTAPVAMAKAGDVIERGSCSGASNWKLKLSPQDGKIEVEFEVDSNHAGQTWQVRLTKNGTQIFSGTKVTQAPSGPSMRAWSAAAVLVARHVERVANNAAGIAARVRFLVTGESGQIED